MSEHGWTPPGGGPAGGPPDGPAGGTGEGTRGPSLTKAAPAAGPHPAPSPGPNGPGGPVGPGRGGPRRPGIVPLRPLRLGEIWDGAFQAVRTNPRALLGPTLAVVLVITAVTSAASAVALGDAFTGLGQPGSTGAELTSDLVTVVGPTLASSLLALVGTSLLAGMITLAVSGAVLGRRVSAGELWQRVRGRVPALVLLALITGLALALVVVVAVAPGVVVAVVGGLDGSDTALGIGVVLAILGALLGLLGYLALDARLFLAAPVLVLEGAGPVDALRRAWGLSARGFWRLLGIRLLTTLLLSVISLVFSVPFQVIGGILGFVAGGQDDPASLLLLSIIPAAIGQVLVGLVVYPLQAATTALQYTDQRMRLEGLDLELIRAADAA